MRHYLRTAGLTIGLAVALSAGARAASQPPSGQLDFDVMRNGADIGDHRFIFSGSPARLRVQVETDIHVQVPLIHANLYTFTQRSTEAWQGGHLAKLMSTTDDNGTPHRISVGASQIPPASLWSVDTTEATSLLNTIDGSVMRIKVSDLGAGRAAGGTVSGEHYRISGDLEREVWYGADGLLAGMTMTAQDGSQVTYVRK